MRAKIIRAKIMNGHGKRFSTPFVGAACGLCSLVATSAALSQTQQSAASSSANTQTQQVRTEDSAAIEELIVTATRRSETALEVPLSLSAYSQVAMDRLGVKEVDDIGRMTPGVQFSRAEFGGGNRSSISIRGISSSVGAGTTGVYIDDTPIQVRNVFFSTTNAYPKVFDLERVEVLRGPQGTLFGAGSEGGTIRFIAPAADFEKFGGYARTEASYTEHGDPSYEAGVALNMPVSNKLAIRASAWHQHQGGWVDRVQFDNPSQVLDDNSNSNETTNGRIAFAFAPTENLAITPSVFYQEEKSDGGATYWVDLSDAGDGHWLNGNTLPSPGKDKYYVAALALDWNFGSVDLISNTSYFDRTSRFYPDYTGTTNATLRGDSRPFYPGDAHQGFWFDDQRTFTQELRLQSSGEQRLSWVLGAFYSRAKQRDQQLIGSPDFDNYLSLLLGLPVTTEDVFGMPLVDGYYVYITNDFVEDEQTALYGQVDFKLTDAVTLTAGLRAAETKFSFVSKTNGPYLGVEDFSGDTTENPLTPKIGISYQVDDRLLYASASKGFRVGGAQRPVPVACQGDLDELGIDNAPITYDSDSVWSYEVGIKDAAFNNRLQVETSVFYIDWKNIQQGVPLPNCNLSFIDNLGSAVSKGFDVSLRVQPTDALTLGLAVGYTDAYYTEDIPATAGLFVVRNGGTLGFAPWTAHASAQYDFTLGNVDAYIRSDYDYESHNDDPLDPSLTSYDSTPRPPETHFVTLRAGGRVSGFDVSLFVDNLFNAQRNFGLAHDTLPSPVWFGGTFRPRTIGVTATYRY